MGCFNSIAFYSNIPILFQDKIKGFICVSFTDKIRDNTHIAPFDICEPLFLPINGSYNDYGSIFDIEKDNNVSSIEKFFQLDIETIVKAIQNFEGYTLNDIKKELKEEHKDKTALEYISILKKIKKIFKNNIEINFDDDISLLMTYELSEVYNKICELYDDNSITNTIKQIIDIFTKWNIENFNIFDRFIIDRISDLAYKNILINIKDNPKETINIMNKLNEDRDLLNNLKSQMIVNYKGIMNMSIYDFLDFKPKDNIKILKDYYNFIFAMQLTCRSFYYSNYGNQNIMREAKNLIELYQTYINIIKEKELELNE